MFRPDPNGELSVDEVIADLTALLADVPPDSPRALKLAEFIRGLRGRGQRRAAAALVRATMKFPHLAIALLLLFRRKRSPLKFLVRVQRPAVNIPRNRPCKISEWTGRSRSARSHRISMAASRRLRLGRRVGFRFFKVRDFKPPRLTNRILPNRILSDAGRPLQGGVRRLRETATLHQQGSSASEACR
jgi:hypothetical protein